MFQQFVRVATSMLAITMVALVALVMMVAASVFGSEPSHSEESRRAAAAEAVRNACHADIEKLCPGVQQGGGRILRCLRDKQDQISEGCKSALQSLRQR